MNFRGILSHFNLDDRLFDFRYNYAYAKRDNEEYIRGGRKYYRPYGWYRIALNVSGRYDNGNDDWMKDNHNTNEWVNAYHGTKIENVKSILEEGLHPGTRNAYGYGIYCTPLVETAAGYAQEFEYEGEKYKVVIQVRVKPDEMKETIYLGGREDYWYIEDTKDIRNLCILLKKVDKEDYILPEDEQEQIQSLYNQLENIRMQQPSHLQRPTYLEQSTYLEQKQPNSLCSVNCCIIVVVLAFVLIYIINM